MTTSLQIDDMRRILRAMPKDCREQMMRLAKGRTPVRIFLAGGAIRAVVAGEPISDWDFLGESAEAVEDFITRVRSSRGGYPARVHKSKNALTLLTLGHSPVQGITRWTYRDPEQLLAEFDFSIAQAVMWFDKADGWHSACGEGFYPDLAAKRLTYMSPNRQEDAGGSMLRVTKFLRRGYSISPEALGKVIGRLAEQYRPDADMPAWRVITGLLREVDPLTRFDGLDIDDGEKDPLDPEAVPIDDEGSITA